MQEQYAAMNNAAIEDLPEDLVITTHDCRGNYHSTWASAGGYATVADVLFGKENVAAYYLSSTMTVPVTSNRSPRFPATSRSCSA